MDAKSKANFINSVANEQEVVCVGCGAKNKADSRFCIACGKEITIVGESSNSTPAFAPVAEGSPDAATGEKPVHTPKVEKYVEPKNVFARGLPSWNIEPPQVMVRRR